MWRMKWLGLSMHHSLNTLSPELGSSVPRFPKGDIHEPQAKKPSRRDSHMLDSAEIALVCRNKPSNLRLCQWSSGVVDGQNCQNKSGCNPTIQFGPSETHFLCFHQDWRHRDDLKVQVLAKGRSGRYRRRSMKYKGQFEGFYLFPGYPSHKW